jgi:hypothetical protein
MARRVMLSRDEAEWLVDLLERDGSVIARDLADEIRAIFGMAPRDRPDPADARQLLRAHR